MIRRGPLIVALLLILVIPTGACWPCRLLGCVCFRRSIIRSRSISSLSLSLGVAIRVVCVVYRCVAHALFCFLFLCRVLCCFIITSVMVHMFKTTLTEEERKSKLRDTSGGHPRVDTSAGAYTGKLWKTDQTLGKTLLGETPFARCDVHSVMVKDNKIINDWIFMVSRHCARFRFVFLFQLRTTVLLPVGYPFPHFPRGHALSLSLSLSHTHTHTHQRTNTCMHMHPQLSFPMPYNACQHPDCLGSIRKNATLSM